MIFRRLDKNGLEAIFRDYGSRAWLRLIPARRSEFRSGRQSARQARLFGGRHYPRHLRSCILDPANIAENRGFAISKLKIIKSAANGLRLSP